LFGCGVNPFNETVLLMVLSFFNNNSEFNPEKPLPPLHLWNPEFCGDIDIKIDSQGQWFHEGTPIRRQKLVDLYSTILKREGDQYYLVTPHEKCRITVELAPFLITEWDVMAQGTPSQIIKLKTQQGYWFDIDREHGIWIQKYNDSEYPLVHIRSQLNGILTRNVHYQLAELVQSNEVSLNNNVTVFDDPNHLFEPNPGTLGLLSHQQFFPLLSEG
jgi:hypothetical protein